LLARAHILDAYDKIGQNLLSKADVTTLEYVLSNIFFISTMELKH